MKGGRGQGLPLNVIVLAAIAILVLVLIIAFASGAIGRLFGSTTTIENAVTPEQLSGFRLGCQKACFETNQLAKNPEEWLAGEYCTKKLNETNCWEANITCSKSFFLEDGTKKECKNPCNPCA